MNRTVGGPHRGHAAGDTDVEKAASQLVSDTKYKVKQRMGQNISRLSPAAVAKAYLAQLEKSPASPAVKAIAKKKLLGAGIKEEYGIDQLASSTIASAMYKVFVEGVKLSEEEDKAPSSEEKFLIVVTDKATGNEYRRKATRAKIAELRANPNIARVEITQYGKPYDKEAEKGEQTAAVKSGKGLAKRDYDGDGKVESGAKEYRGAVHNAIQKKRGLPADGKDTSSVKEELVGKQKNIDVAEPYGKLTKDDFKKLRDKKNKVMESFFEQKAPTKDQNEAEIVSNEEKGVDNRKIIKVFPELGMKESALNTFLELIQEKKMTAKNKAKEKRLKKKYDKSSMKANMIDQYGEEKGKEVYFAKIRGEAMKEGADQKDQPKLDSQKPCDDDPRSMKTKLNLVRNKLRSMGLNMSYEPEGEQLDEIWPLVAAGAALAAPAVIKAVFDKPVKKALDKATNDPNRPLLTGGTVGQLKQAQNNSFEPEGEVVSEEESDARRDKEQMEKGMDRPSRYAGGRNPNRPAAQTGPKKKPTGTPDDAFKSVVASLQAQHGPNAVMASMRTRKGRQG